ncbi:MAG: hypothetical protein Sylvanvirus1_78 [Sylvanvirus sp.]|uniref:Uncharacterized protein n=1 Tax=Sylvanvirus sp. TaxID=2487774 RepID=A0A3G5AH07_9VIRU|nr:MAG: hypothetical protein Sylvanvirus1_78 [Sylvanvirus sp.]
MSSSTLSYPSQDTLDECFNRGQFTIFPTSSHITCDRCQRSNIKKCLHLKTSDNSIDICLDCYKSIRKYKQSQDKSRQKAFKKISKEKENKSNRSESDSDSDSSRSSSSSNSSSSNSQESVTKMEISYNSRPIKPHSQRKTKMEMSWNARKNK